MLWKPHAIRPHPRSAGFSLLSQMQWTPALKKRYQCPNPAGKFAKLKKKQRNSERRKPRAAWTGKQNNMTTWLGTTREVVKGSQARPRPYHRSARLRLEVTDCPVLQHNTTALPPMQHLLPAHQWQHLLPAHQRQQPQSPLLPNQHHARELLMQWSSSKLTKHPTHLGLLPRPGNTSRQTLNMKTWGDQKHISNCQHRRYRQLRLPHQLPNQVPSQLEHQLPHQLPHQLTHQLPRKGMGMVTHNLVLWRLWFQKDVEKKRRKKRQTMPDLCASPGTSWVPRLHDLVSHIFGSLLVGCSTTCLDWWCFL